MSYKEIGEFEKELNKLPAWVSFGSVVVGHGEAREIIKQADTRIASQQREIDELKSAIRETLKENANLADGDNCTLIKLKNVLS